MKRKETTGVVDFDGMISTASLIIEEEKFRQGFLVYLEEGVNLFEIK